MDRTPAELSTSTLDEYRTYMSGEEVEPAGVEQGLAVTKGFASAAVYFHPLVRSDSFFAYLGKQQVGGRGTDVVAFAQRPGWAEVTGHLRVAGRPDAWITAHSETMLIGYSFELVVSQFDVEAALRRHMAR